MSWVHITFIYFSLNQLGGDDFLVVKSGSRYLRPSFESESCCVRILSNPHTIRDRPRFNWIPG